MLWEPLVSVWKGSTLDVVVLYISVEGRFDGPPAVLGGLPRVVWWSGGFLMIVNILTAIDEAFVQIVYQINPSD